MGRKTKMTKRQREAAAKRAAIMGTREFQEWWRARCRIHPIPSDPFRAFMIDRGIPAPITTKEDWKPRTNWVDTVPIDNFHGGKGRRRSRRTPRKPPQFRKGYVPKAARPIGKLTPLEEQLKAHVRKMAEHYHVPEPEIFFERGEGQLASAAYLGGAFGVKPFLKIGVKGLKEKSLPLHLGTTGHEMGHQVHRRGQVGLLKALSIKGFYESGKIEQERIAWKIADPFMTMKRPAQKWLKKFALGSYLGTSSRRSERRR